MTESNRIEYKRELTEGLEKEVIAFLNYKGEGLRDVPCYFSNFYPTGIFSGQAAKLDVRFNTNVMQANG